MSPTSALVILLLRLAPAAIAGQPPATSVTLRVVDRTDTPVSEAEVALRGDRSRPFQARTDSAGTAIFTDVPDGLWVVTVRRLGLKPATITIRVAAGINRFTLTAESNALLLTGLRVVGGEVYARRLDDFERRRLAGVPSAVVSREEIDRLAPVKTSRLLRVLPGIRVGDSLGSTVAISSRGAKPTPQAQGRTGFALVQCVMRLAVDGILLPALSNIDEIVPRDIHGIEVYFGPARMPPELAGLRTDNWCGLVAIWTRDR